MGNAHAGLQTGQPSTYTFTYTFSKEVDMSQITLYLDEATQALVEQAAKANGVSKSRWVAGIIRKHAAHDWPQECLELAGRFPDFPMLDQPQTQGTDAPRLLF
jgi:hypothetical protein